MMTIYWPSVIQVRPTNEFWKLIHGTEHFTGQVTFQMQNQHHQSSDELNA